MKTPVSQSFSTIAQHGPSPGATPSFCDHEVWIGTSGMLMVYAAYALFFISVGVWQIFKQWHDSSFNHETRKTEKSHLLFEEDGEDLLQQGYRRPVIGQVLYYALIALALGTQGFCVVIWMSDQVIPAKQSYICWDPKARALIMAWCLSAFCLSTLRLFWNSIQTLFMLRAPLSDCTDVIVWRRNDDEGDEDQTDRVSAIISQWKSTLAENLGLIQPGWSRFIVNVKVAEEASLRYFDLVCTRYVYCRSIGEFRESEGTLVMGVRELSSAHEHGGLIEAAVARRQLDYGVNKIHVEVPSFYVAVASEFSDPILILQLLFLYVTLFFRMTVSAIIWGGMIVFGSITRVVLVRRNQLRVRDMAESSSQQIVTVLRDGVKKSVIAEQLVPGDVVEVEDDWPVPCDLALISGQVAVSEANLTGESIPVQKFALPPSDALLEPEGSARKYCLFAGSSVITKVGQATSGPESDGDSHLGRVMGVAVRTGAATTKGHLIKDILFPNQLRFKYIDQLPVVFFITGGYALLLMVAIGSIMGPGAATVFYGLNTVAQVAPVWLSTILSVGQNAAATRLANSKHRIACLAPARIAICGKIRVMCFDKTGTLTKDSIDFVGVQPVVQIKEHPPQYGPRVDVESPPCANKKLVETTRKERKFLPAARMDGKFFMGVACCHSLVDVEMGGERQLIGSDLEKRMFLSTGWKIDGSTIRSPHGTNQCSLEVLKVFEFDHVRQTMGVVVRNKGTSEVSAFIKGSYEKIANLCTDGLPDDYMQNAEAHAKEGMYVLSLATRTLDPEISMDTFTRDDMETGGRFCGLLLFRNDIKPETPDAIKQLRDGRIRPVIITGDNALTAIAVARRAQMIRRSPYCSPADHTSKRFMSVNASVLALHGSEKHTSSQTGHPLILGDVCDGNVLWSDVDTGEVIDEVKIYKSEAFRELAVTSAAFAHLLEEKPYTDSDTNSSFDGEDFEREERESVSSNLTCLTSRSSKSGRLNSILMRIRIFARMNPQGKVAVIKQFMEKGYITGMCGDGGNDCGALRAAHAGIALSDAEASIVSPFSAKSKMSTAVPELLKEGRGSLVTSLSCYKFQITYGLLVSAARLVLLWLSSGNMGDFAFLTTDCVICMFYAYTMTLSLPKSGLSSRTPTSSLLGPSTILSVVSMYLVNLLGLASLYLVLRFYSGIPSPKQWNESFPQQEWWVRADNFDSAAVFIWVAMQYVNAGLIFAFGGVFRRNAFRNIPFTAAWLLINSYLLYLLLGGSTWFHCLFRVNCTTAHSMSLKSSLLEKIAFCGDGGPFRGEGGHNVFPIEVKFALLGVIVANALANIFIHKFIIHGFPADYYRKKYAAEAPKLVV